MTSVRLALLALVLAAAFGGAFYARSLDPRPMNEAMKRDMEAKVMVLLSVGTPADAAGMAGQYAELARSIARTALDYGSDPDLRLYAQGIAERPPMAVLRKLAATDIEAMHAALLTDLGAALRHVGTADDRFVRIMLPLERSLAELGRLVSSNSEPPATALRVTDAATLMSASAVLALTAWSTRSAHSH